MTLRAVLADIEGTTTAISFVHDVLFPLARRELAGFISAHREDRAHAADFASVRAAIAAETGGSAARVTDEEIVATLTRWIDEDRKDTALKSIQGAIWRGAYRRGEVRSHVYPDVPAALARWRAAGLQLFIYSSGSVEAQKLLFANTEAGDLTPLLSGYFDTHVGAKRDQASYVKIARAIAVVPAEILFLSDVTDELDAAARAGMRTALLDRSGAPDRGSHPRAATFDEAQSIIDAID